MMKIALPKNAPVKNILSAITIAVLGFILLNLAFISDFLMQSLIIKLIEIFTPVDFTTNFQWFPPVMHWLFVVIIGVISWFVFRSKLGTFYKAIYLILPVALVSLTSGMFLGQWPIISFSISALFNLGVLYYLYRTKQPWLYFYSTILISLVMLIGSILGTEI